MSGDKVGACQDCGAPDDQFLVWVLRPGEGHDEQPFIAVAPELGFCSMGNTHDEAVERLLARIEEWENVLLERDRLRAELFKETAK